ncbi:hypothetical protein HU200_059181 [Digitaria exilis]|uniref:Uncharacterized protein n=1 Tax=Digitaria exilis TaxID=1010633 RepID=A0A835E3I7_9POAL|nr:hypothetical protein HU200_059181 [Digitaria exilis]
MYNFDRTRRHYSDPARSKLLALILHAAFSVTHHTTSGHDVLICSSPTKISNLEAPVNARQLIRLAPCITDDAGSAYAMESDVFLSSPRNWKLALWQSHSHRTATWTNGESATMAANRNPAHQPVVAAAVVHGRRDLVLDAARVLMLYGVVGVSSPGDAMASLILWLLGVWLLAFMPAAGRFPRAALVAAAAVITAALGHFFASSN